MTPAQHAKVVGALNALATYWTAQAAASKDDPELAAFCAGQSAAAHEAAARHAAAAPAVEAPTAG